MKKKHLWIFFTGIFIFFLLLGFSLLTQSAYLIYAASVVPLLTVPFIPDIRSNQWLKPSTRDENLLIYKLAEGEETEAEQIIIEFKPGTVNWKRHMLYIKLDNLTTLQQTSSISDAATVPILQYDLIAHPRKMHWFGIQLENVVERISSFSFTTKEVNRFTIRIQDIQELAPSPEIPLTISSNKGLQA
jgi:hypothetical protein